jgi:TonB family protein
MCRRFLTRIVAIFSIAPFAAFSLLAAQSFSLEEPLKKLATDIAHDSKKLHCPHAGCTFLVTNFVADDGDTSKFATQVADSLSEQLSHTKSANAADRSTFQKFLQSERLAARVQSEDSVARWLARRLGANAVIVGKVTVNPSGEGRLFVTLLEPDEKKGKAVPLSATFKANISDADLAPSDGLDHLGPAISPVSGEPLYIAGRKGVTMPRCVRMPNPSYTDDARAAKYSGTILVDGYISANGEGQVLRILKGAPYGLNDSTREMISTWKCSPAQLDGKPVAVTVPFEVSFRLY